MLAADRNPEVCHVADEVMFRGRVRRWDESKPGGLAVVDIPAEHVAVLGGRRQYRVEGTLNGTSFGGSTMLVAGGGFAVGVSKASLKSARGDVGDEVTLVLRRPASS
jgi:Domain of unknown function (DUF1905)